MSERLQEALEFAGLSAAVYKRKAGFTASVEAMEPLEGASTSDSGETAAIRGAVAAYIDALTEHLSCVEKLLERIEDGEFDEEIEKC